MEYITRIIYIFFILLFSALPSHGQNATDEVLDQWNEGVALWNAGNYDESINTLSILCDDIRDRSDVLPLMKVSMNYNLGDMLYQLDRYEEAAMRFEEAMRHWDNIGLSMITEQKVNILAGLTKSYYKLKGYEEAVRWGNLLLRDTKRLYNRFSPQYLNNLYWVGAAKFYNRDYAEAREDLRNYVNLYSYNSEVDSTGSQLIMAYYYLGSCHQNVLDHGAALEAFETADSLCYAWDANVLTHVLVKNSLGVEYINYEDFDAALACFDEAIELIESIDPELEDTSNVGVYLLVMQNVATISVTQGEYSDALEVYKNLLDIYQDIGYTDKPIYGRTLANYAMCLGLSGETEKAALFTFAADEMLSQTGYNSGEDYIIIKLLKMYYLLDAGESETLINECRSFAAYAAEQILSTFPYLTEKERAQFWNKLSGWYSIALPSIARLNPTPELTRLFYDGVLQSKGILLNSSMNIDRMLRIANKESLYNLQSQRLRAIEMTTDAPIVDELERRLLRELMPYGNFMEDIVINSDSIKRSLAADEIAIEFVAAENWDDDDTTYVALTLRAGYDAPLLTELFTQRDIDSLTATSPMTELDASLYDLLWAKFEDELSGINRIYFAADGSLYRIPVEYCETPDGQRMADKYECCRISSTRELTHHRHDTQSPHDVTMYGDIDYDASYDDIRAALSRNYNEEYTHRMASASAPSVVDEAKRAMTRDGRGVAHTFEKLKYAAGEIHAIDSLCKAKGIDTKVLGSCHGSEESAQRLSSPGVLHFATHGVYFTPQDGERLTYVKRLSDRTDYLNEPLTRSALILAGANNAILDDYDPTMEDGFLTALDISSIDLRGTDLVVLSACESGLGDIGADGVFGLQRGFKQAGAHSLVMSLVNVNDYVAGVFFSAFFDSYLSDGDKQRALRHAQGVVRQADGGRWNKTEYWAPFVLLDGNK